MIANVADALEHCSTDPTALRGAAARVAATRRGAVAALLAKRSSTVRVKRSSIAALLSLGRVALPHVERILRRLATQTTTRAGRIRWLVAIELTRQWSSRSSAERREAAAVLASSLRYARSNAQSSSWIAADVIIDLLGTGAIHVLDEVLRSSGPTGRKAVIGALIRLGLEGRSKKRLEGLLRRLAANDPAPSVRSGARTVLRLYERDIEPRGRRP